MSNTTEPGERLAWLIRQAKLQREAGRTEAAQELEDCVKAIERVVQLAITLGSCNELLAGVIRAASKRGVVFNQHELRILQYASDKSEQAANMKLQKGEFG